MKYFLVGLSLAVLTVRALATDDFPHELSNGTVTGHVDQVFVDPTQFSLAITNVPGGGRRGVLEFIGSGGGGGGSNLVLVAEPGVIVTSPGANTNGIGTDFSLVVSNPALINASNTIMGVVNGLMSDTNAFIDGGHTNNLADKTLVTSTSNTVASVAQASLLATSSVLQTEIANVAAGTNATVLAPGFAETFYGANGTNYLAVDGTQVALLASNQTFTATNDFTGKVFLKGGTVISNSPSIIGDLSATGTVSAANLLGALNGTNLTGIGSVSTGLLARVSNNSGTIGGAGNYLVVTFDPNTGLPIAWTTAQGPPAGAATNAVTFLENAINGNTYNNVNGIIFTNVPYFTQNQSTNTLGFSNVVFDTVQLAQGGTNFVLHGATLSFTNANTQGLAFALTNGGTLTVSGSISNLAAAGTPTSLTYAHSIADNGSGTGTLTMNALGGDLDIVLSSNQSGQALYVSEDTKTSFTFKHDTSAQVYTKEFKTALSLDTVVIYEITPSLGNPGFTWDFGAPHMCQMINLGLPWSVNGYSTMAGAANLIIDQFNNQSQDNHKWYPGNNTNFPALWVKAGGYSLGTGGTTTNVGGFGYVASTSAVMNSDWINIGAASSTNGTIKAAFIGVASNEDFLAVWPSLAMSQNGTNGYVWTTGNGGYNGVMQYSTNSTDAQQFGTNRFGGFLFGHNGTFGAAVTNVIAHLFRDETNGLQVVTVSTNFGGSIYLGPTNNLYRILLGGGPSMTLPVNGSTLYITNGQLVGTSTP